MYTLFVLKCTSLCVTYIALESQQTGEGRVVNNNAGYAGTYMQQHTYYCEAELNEMLWKASKKTPPATHKYVVRTAVLRANHAVEQLYQADTVCL